MSGGLAYFAPSFRQRPGGLVDHFGVAAVGPPIEGVSDLIRRFIIAELRLAWHEERVRWAPSRSASDDPAV